jgi:hypothetical protein
MKMIFKPNIDPVSLSFGEDLDHQFRSHWTNGYDMSEISEDGVYLTIQSFNSIMKRRSDNSNYRESSY